jgi:hypothetical protein
VGRGGEGEGMGRGGEGEEWVQDNVDWIRLNHNRLLWQADVKTVTNLQVPHNKENFLAVQNM